MSRVDRHTTSYIEVSAYKQGNRLTVAGDLGGLEKEDFSCLSSRVSERLVILLSPLLTYSQVVFSR